MLLAIKSLPEDLRAAESVNPTFLAWFLKRMSYGYQLNFMQLLYFTYAVYFIFCLLSIFFAL